MIKEVRIRNYKSVVDAKLSLGRFNVMIGANGCGKSNLLEGIAMAGAASANKLDNEFFDNRGIRVTDPNLMLSAFENNRKTIDIRVRDEQNVNNFSIYYNRETTPAKWSDAVTEHTNEVLDEWHKSLNNTDVLSSIKALIGRNDDKLNFAIRIDQDNINISRLRSKILSSFVIFSPEESMLRKFDKESGVYPLGKNGDGLFKYLKDLSQNTKYQELLNEIIDNLYLLDWFDDISIPENQLSNDYSIKLKDRFIEDTIEYIDQRSTNEGFLFLLFYVILFVSPDTPSFFAIDNIEKSFNPKLCTRIIRSLTALSKKYNKQVIITTHNPYALDGLDLSDDEQRLFVARRNMDGYTQIDSIKYDKDRTMLLSEVWMKGMIGGLPDNF